MQHAAKLAIAAKIAVFAAALAPALWLAWRTYHGDLGINPAETLQLETGIWTLRFLVFTLAITPLRRITGWNRAIQFRRMIGLYAFFYGVLHFTTWFWLDKNFDLQEMIKDVGKRPFITVGFLGFILMIPLAVTSTQWAIRKLGKDWASLHRLVYLSAIAGVVHYWWLVKIDIRKPLRYAVILTLLLGWRIAVWAIKRYRTHGAPAAAPQGAD